MYNFKVTTSMLNKNKKVNILMKTDTKIPFKKIEKTTKKACYCCISIIYC